MKNLKIKPGTFQLKELSEKIYQHFNSIYTVTDNNMNEIVIARNKSIGCKLILTKKRLLIAGTFPTKGRMILAILILILGGIIIPMGIYLIAFKGKFEAMEKEVYTYIKSEFPDRLA